jgi:hypothetical protein
MTRKTRETISVLMVFCSVFAAFAATLAHPAPASASLVATAAAMVILVGESVAVLVEQKLLTQARESIQEAGQSIFERAVSEMKFDTTMYMHDHRPLATSMSSAIGNGFDFTSETSALFTRFSDAGVVSFPSPGAGAPPSEQIAYFANGRTGNPGSRPFTVEYEARLSSLAKYARGVMEGGDADRDTLAGYQDTIKKMDDALRFNIEKGKLTDIWENEYNAMRDFHDKLPYNAADPYEFQDTGDEDFLKDEILIGPGYTQTMAATGQMAAFRNILFSGIRAAGARQAEADAKFALNAQREREDSRLAFERSVGAWNASAPSVY